MFFVYIFFVYKLVYNKLNYSATLSYIRNILYLKQYRYATCLTANNFSSVCVILFLLVSSLPISADIFIKLSIYASNVAKGYQRNVFKFSCSRLTLAFVKSRNNL